MGRDMGSALRGGRRQIPCYRAINREIFLFLRRIRQPFENFAFIDNGLVIPPFSITGKSAAITGNFRPAVRRFRARRIWCLASLTVREKVIAGILCISFRETMQRSGSLLNQHHGFQAKNPLQAWIEGLNPARSFLLARGERSRLCTRPILIVYLAPVSLAHGHATPNVCDIVPHRGRFAGCGSGRRFACCNARRASRRSNYGEQSGYHNRLETSARAARGR